MPIPRRTLNTAIRFLTVICLVAITALWLRSYHFGDWTTFRSAGRSGGSIISDGGQLQFRLLTYDTALGRTDTDHGCYPILPPSPSSGGGGFFGGHERTFDEQEEDQLLAGPINDSIRQRLGIADPINDSGWQRLGFAFQADHWTYTSLFDDPPGPNAPRSYHHWTLVIPYWYLFAAVASSPTWRILRAIHRRRSRQFQPGFCRKCGYDLRATPDRCPECGLASV